MRGSHAIVFALGLLCAGGCGKKKDDPAPGSGGPAPAGSGAAKPGKPAAATTCDEKHEVTVTLSGKETRPAPPAGPLTVSSSVGFQSGMVWNGADVTKIVYVVLANYPVKMGPYAFEYPTTPDRVAVQLGLSSKTVAAAAEAQKTAYAALEMTPGSYPIGTGGTEPHLDATFFVGSESPSGSGLTDATGGATITKYGPDRVCGSIDVSSPAGTTIKGTFNVALEGDLWAK